MREQLSFEVTSYGGEQPEPTEIDYGEQLELFDGDDPESTWTYLLKTSPLDNPHDIGTFDEDQQRFKQLDTVEARAEHLMRIGEEVTNLRCIRDTRVIYDVDLDTMSQLLNLDDPVVLEAWEAPEACQDPEYEFEGGELIMDVMRLFVVLEELGYRRDEVKQIVTQDVDFIAPFFRRGNGGYQSFINKVWPYWPYSQHYD